MVVRQSLLTVDSFALTLQQKLIDLMNRQLIVLTEKGVDNVYAALKYLPGVMFVNLNCKQRLSYTAQMFKKSQIHKQLDMFSSQANLMCDRERPIRRP